MCAIEDAPRDIEIDYGWKETIRVFLMASERWSYLGRSVCAYDGVRDYGT